MDEPEKALGVGSKITRTLKDPGPGLQILLLYVAATACHAVLNYSQGANSKLTEYSLTSVVRALVTIGAAVDSMSSVTSVSSLVSAVMVATAVVSVYTWPRRQADRPWSQGVAQA